jgi:two-component system phosphate regulon sensor histidine kinase PhoR
MKRLLKILAPTAVLVVVLIAAGVIAAVPAMAILAAVALGAFWAYERQAYVTVERRPEEDTAIAAAILDSLPDPVMLVDSGRKVIAANKASRDLLGDGVLGRGLSLSLRNPEALKAVSDVLAGGAVSGFSVSFSVPVFQTFDVHVTSFPPMREGGARAIVLLHDVSSTAAAERMRADFVANVSHELRSPLSSLVGFIETLKGAAKNDTRARERFLDIMDGEAQRMARLIDDLLSLSKVESLEHVRPKGEVDLVPVLKEVRDTLMPRAGEKYCEIIFEFVKDLPSIPGDRDELAEVFHNLMDNAVKYGRPGTPVTVTMEMAERIPDVGNAGLKISIRDKGDGIPEEHIPRLTERFYRVDKGRSRSLGGTGLGLAIVKHIINHHRGRLVIESHHGKGSTFIVYLPLEAEPTPQAIENGITMN